MESAREKLQKHQIPHVLLAELLAIDTAEISKYMRCGQISEEKKLRIEIAVQDLCDVCSWIDEVSSLGFPANSLSVNFRNAKAVRELIKFYRMKQLEAATQL